MSPPSGEAPGAAIPPTAASRGERIAPARTRFDVEAPAKVNLGLRIVGVRDDGYHLLESVFAPVDLHDDLTLELREARGAGSDVDLEVCFEGAGWPTAAADVPTDDRNLAVKAARRFLDEANLHVHVSMALTKRIPAAAGLGGGSSDAAAVLRCLDHAWPGRVSRAALAELALGLGADVPFFLDSRPALVAGVGEQCRPLEAWPSLALVLANPRRPVSTAGAFGRWDETSAPTPQGEIAQALEDLRASGWRVDDPAWGRLLRNDLEAAAGALCPEMAGLREQLQRAGALVTAQSGSGATVYGVFADRQLATRAYEELSVNDSAWFRVANSLGAR